MSSSTLYRGGQRDTAPILLGARRVRHMATVPPVGDPPRTGRLGAGVWIVVAVLGVLSLIGAITAGVAIIAVVTGADSIPEAFRAGGYTLAIIAAMACLIFGTAAVAVWALASTVTRLAGQSAAQHRALVETCEQLRGALVDMMDRYDAADAVMVQHGARLDEMDETLRQLATAEAVMARAVGGTVRALRPTSVEVPGARRH